MKHFTRLLLLSLVVISFSSCLKDKFDINEMGTNKWNPDIAAPVINTSVSMLDVTKEVENAQWGIGSDNLVSLIYIDEIFTNTAEDLISIPDQMVDTTLLWNYPVGIPPGDSASQSYIYSKSLHTTNNEVVDTLYLKNGMLSYSIESDMNHDGKMIITVPGLVKNGQPFQTTLLLDYNGSLPVTASGNYDVSGYKALFTHSGQKNYLNSTVKVVGYGDNNPVNSPYSFNIQSGFTNIRFSKIYGYFDQYDFDIDSDSLEIELFDNKDFGNFTIEDPRVILRFYNSFGMPIEGYIKSLRTYKAPNTVEITKPGGAPLDDIIIDYPQLSQIGDVVITEKLLDRNNSNIDDAIDINPQWVIYDVDGMSNPSGNPYNFALDTSKLKLETETEFPLFGAAWGFTLRDTIDFDLGEGLSEEGELQSAQLQIFLRNGFPVETKVQVYFTDTNMVVLDSLFADGAENILLPATPGPAPKYKVSTPMEKMVYVKKDKQAINNILDAKKAVIKVMAATIDNGNSTVKIYSDYTVDLKLGVRAKFETDF